MHQSVTHVVTDYKTPNDQAHWRDVGSVRGRALLYFLFVFPEAINQLPE
jgi:hypothetical protein